MTDFFYDLGDFFQATFKILPKLGNLPNNIFMIIGFIALVLWLRQMAIYNKEAEEKGTLK